MSDELTKRFAAMQIGTTFATIDQIVQAMDAADVWTDEARAAAEAKWKKAEARRLIRKQKDETGWPLWFSVVVADDQGVPQRVYAQEALFSLDQYKQVIGYHRTLSLHHAATANELCRRARRRFKVDGRQLRLPFPDQV